MSSPLLEVKDLQVTVGEENKVLLDGLNLTVNPGETHVLMGHNGAGKSTLMSALMGDPRYNVTRGQIIFRGQDITHETADVRARAGMFLSFQTPEEIPGITLESFLRTAQAAVTGKPVKVMKFRHELAAQMEALNMDPLIALLAAWIFSQTPEIVFQDILIVFYLGVVVTGFAYLLYGTALKTTRVSTCVALGLLEPVTAFVLAIVVVGENVNPWATVGLLAILAGLALVLRSEQKQNTAS